MSRASDVRDALVDSLSVEFPNNTVEAVVHPLYDRDELSNTPRIPVMVGGRELTIGQVDERRVIIGVGVVGVVKPSEGYSLDAAVRRAKAATASDELDNLMESILALWTPDDDATAKFRNGAFAEHAFHDIDQPVLLDYAQYKEKGIWVSVVNITFTDTKDE